MIINQSSKSSSMFYVKKTVSFLSNSGGIFGDGEANIFSLITRLDLWIEFLFTEISSGITELLEDLFYVSSWI